MAKYSEAFLNQLFEAYRKAYEQANGRGLDFSLKYEDGWVVCAENKVIGFNFKHRVPEVQDMIVRLEQRAEEAKRLAVSSNDILSPSKWLEADPERKGGSTEVLMREYAEYYAKRVHRDVRHKAVEIFLEHAAVDDQDFDDFTHVVERDIMNISFKPAKF